MPEWRSVDGALDKEFAVDDAAKSDADGGQARREHFRVADEGGVGLQVRRFGGNELFDEFAADLFFAFQQHADVDGQLSVFGHELGEGLDLDPDLPFVVDGAAGIDVFIANGRLEGGGDPFVQRIGGLNIVVAIEEEGRLARGVEPFGVDQRVSAFLRCRRTNSMPARRSASAAKLAARRTSDLCSGTVQMLGMRRKAERPSRTACSGGAHRLQMPRHGRRCAPQGAFRQTVAREFPMHTNRLAREESLSASARAQSGGLVPLGRGGVRKGARARTSRSFLSIGYSTCHWCHVMERESFETEEIAELLNRAFVPIKVDREERPDVDRIYMTVRPGDHRRRRMADVGVADAGIEAVFRRHVFPAG